MTLYIDHIEADAIMGGIPGVRTKVSHIAQMLASEDDIMDFIRKKIQGASAIRLLYTINGDDYFLFTPEETEDAFRGRF